MRNYSWISCAALLVLATIVSGCQDNAQPPSKPGNVRFTIRPRTESGSNGRIATTLPAGALLYITVANASGGEVYTLKPVPLLILNGEYISEPLSLVPGNYTLTEFLVTDAAGQIRYASPKEGASLAPWVDDPLPVAFTVNDNAIIGLDVQVLAIGEHSAEEFGYVTFRVDVVPAPYFRLSVLGYNTDDVLQFVPVTACLLDDADTVYKQVLPAATHAVAVVGDPSRTYTLV